MLPKVLADLKYTAAQYDSDLQFAEGAVTLHTVDVVTTRPNALLEFIFYAPLWSNPTDRILLNIEIDGTEVDSDSEWGAALYTVSGATQRMCVFVAFARVLTPGTHTIEVTWESSTGDIKAGENCYGATCGTTSGRSSFKIVEHD